MGGGARAEEAGGAAAAAAAAAATVAPALMNGRRQCPTGWTDGGTEGREPARGRGGAEREGSVGAGGGWVGELKTGGGPRADGRTRLLRRKEFVGLCARPHPPGDRRQPLNGRRTGGRSIRRLCQQS